MSQDTSWDIEQYREEHESQEHWELRRAFMVQWKNDYPEERLVCLARVFANIEFLGCRYPLKVMHEVARLSEEVAKSYRKSKKGKLQRTFVSASDAAEDRARGTKREGGQIIDGPPSKTSKINFVPQGQVTEKEENNDHVKSSDEENENSEKNIEENKSDSAGSNELISKEYIQEMYKIRSLNIRFFREQMFNTQFGRMVLMVRPWSSKLDNIQASCAACKVTKDIGYNNGCYSISINNRILASANGSKAESRIIAEDLAWQKLITSCIVLVVKQQWIAQNDARITTSDVSGRKKQEQFGTTIESSVATKMMKLMGWAGGGLGAKSQGREEPVQAHLQMVNRAGLGSDTDSRRLRQAAADLMKRYLTSDTLDVDLVFSSEFSKEERATLHQLAKRTGLASNSYGKDQDRFLVVRKKRKDPFDLVREVIEKGGNTPKYQIIIPATLG